MSYDVIMCFQDAVVPEVERGRGKKRVKAMAEEVRLVARLILLWMKCPDGIRTNTIDYSYLMQSAEILSQT